MFLKNFIKKIERINYDKVIFLGDFLGYYYNAEEIILYARKNKFHCILGNHDMYFTCIKEQGAISRFNEKIWKFICFKPKNFKRKH